jgi:NAD(P)-dependent dehydrogenase (short-subunit alcohol dehydrogenase family)
MPGEPGVRTLEQFDIRGRSAIVTGAASGIGLADAEAMAEAGVTVPLLDIDGDGLVREAERLSGEGYAVRMQAVDVTDLDALAGALGAHAADCGGLDIAFANAGGGPGAGFWDPAGHRNPEGQIDTLDPQDWRDSIALNLTGVYHTLREAARLMKPARRGSIIATSSNAAIINEPIVPTPYMPAKAGVAHLVRQVALELAEFGIRVNAIAPGPFVTNIGGGALLDPEVRATWDSRVPLGRIAETWQIKPLALYLASDASSYMTGAQLVIDGGHMLGELR